MVKNRGKPPKRHVHFDETKNREHPFLKDAPPHIEFDVNTKNVMIEFLQNLNAKTKAVSNELNESRLGLPEVFENALKNGLIKIKELEANVRASQSNADLKVASDNIRTLYRGLNPILQKVEERQKVVHGMEEQQTFEKNKKEMFDILQRVNDDLNNTKSEIKLRTDPNLLVKPDPLVENFKTISIKMDELIARVQAAKNKETLKELHPEIINLKQNISTFLQKAAVRKQKNAAAENLNSPYQSIEEVMRNVLLAEKQKMGDYLQKLYDRTRLLKNSLKLPPKHPLIKEFDSTIAKIKSLKAKVKWAPNKTSFDAIVVGIKTFYEGQLKETYKNAKEFSLKQKADHKSPHASAAEKPLITPKMRN